MKTRTLVPETQPERGACVPVLPGATATGPFKPAGDAIITPDESAVVTAAGQGKTQLVGDTVTWVTTQTAVQEYSVSTGKLLVRIEV